MPSLQRKCLDRMVLVPAGDLLAGMMQQHMPPGVGRGCQRPWSGRRRPASHLVCWYKESDLPAIRMLDVGFRCVFVPVES